MNNLDVTQSLGFTKPLPGYSMLTLTLAGSNFAQLTSTRSYSWLNGGGFDHSNIRQSARSITWILDQEINYPAGQ